MTSAARALGLTGEADAVLRMPTSGAVSAPVLALVGVGEQVAPLSHEVLRRAAGAATRQLTGVGSIGLALPAHDTAEVAAVAEGALLGAYAFTRYREAKDGAAPAGRIELITARARDNTAKRAVERAAVVAAAVHGVRDLVNTAPIDLFPAAFADAARAATRGTKVKVTVLDEKALVAGGYGGLVAVGQGSSRPPRLVKVVWSPARPTRSVALVGKGITFDSGGLSIKPAKGMETMKCDMAGAAAVIAATAAIAELGLRIRVTTFAALAENLPSGSAYRPSDVLTMYGGKTVENGNSDAEGRLVMADALVKASEERPSLVIDVATLTGACVVALGERVAGLMARDDETADLILDAAEAAGEQFWQLPITEDARPKLESKVADLKSTGDKYGGALTAAAFLSEFVPEETPWAHLDIAGPSFNSGAPYDYTPAGGTGVGVRTLVALAHALAN